MDISSILPLLLNGKTDEKTATLLKMMSGGKGDISSILSEKGGNFGAIASLLSRENRSKNLHNRFVLNFINDDILGKITKFMAK